MGNPALLARLLHSLCLVDLSHVRVIFVVVAVVGAEYVDGCVGDLVSHCTHSPHEDWLKRKMPPSHVCYRSHVVSGLAYTCKSGILTSQCHLLADLSI